MAAKFTCDICGESMADEDRQYMRFLDLQDVCPNCRDVLTKVVHLMKMRLSGFTDQLKDIHGKYSGFK